MGMVQFILINKRLFLTNLVSCGNANIQNCYRFLNCIIFHFLMVQGKASLFNIKKYNHFSFYCRQKRQKNKVQKFNFIFAYCLELFNYK